MGFLDTLFGKKAEESKSVSYPKATIAAKQRLEEQSQIEDLGRKARLESAKLQLEQIKAKRASLQPRMGGGSIRDVIVGGPSGKSLFDEPSAFSGTMKYGHKPESMFDAPSMFNLGKRKKRD